MLTATIKIEFSTPDPAEATDTLNQILQHIAWAAFVEDAYIEEPPIPEGD